MLIAIQLDYNTSLVVPEKFVPTFLNMVDSMLVCKTEGYSDEKAYLIQQGERVKVTLVYSEKVVGHPQQPENNDGT